MSDGHRPKYVPGDYLMVSDATGFVMRRSEAVRQYDGAWVERDKADYRHPIETPKEPSRPRRLRVTRPESSDTFVDVPDEIYND